MVAIKALSIHPLFAMNIVCGNKTIECRTWKTDYRGDLLICSTGTKLSKTIPGHALGVVTLVDVVPLKKEHLQAAMIPNSAYNKDAYAWILENPRYIEPIPVKGRLSLWNFDRDDEIVYYNPDGKTEEEDEEWFVQHWDPIIV